MYSTLAGGAEHLEIVCVADEQHVTRIGTSTVDCAIELQSPGLAALKRSPRLHSIVTRWDNNGTTSLAGRKSLKQRRAKISALVSLGTIVQDIASLDLGLSSMRGQGSNFARKLAEDGGGQNGDSRNEEGRKVHFEIGARSAGNE